MTSSLTHCRELLCEVHVSVQDALPFSATLQLGHGFQQTCSAER